MPKKGERVKEVTVTVTRKLTQFEKTCPVCQRRFWGAKISRYCSRTCLNKANYSRHAEQYRKARMESYRKQKEQKD